MVQLVQTGKALRASRRDSQGNLSLPQGMSQSKLPATIDLFHRALDELEGEIVRFYSVCGVRSPPFSPMLTVVQLKAKSVLLRDLNQVQAEKSASLGQQQLQPALPIESQTREPIAIDLESSPPPKAAALAKPSAVVAPFPVMTVGDTNGDSGIKTEDFGHSMDNTATTNGTKMEPNAAPEAPMMADANFTDMEFSLAPADGTQATQNTTTTDSFDISSFAPNDTMLSLDSLLPNGGQPTDANAGGDAPVATDTTTEAKTEPANQGVTSANEPNLEEFFDNDGGQADGMDFDFSLGGTGSGGGGGGGGMGEDTFDDLMNDRDGTFELMSNEDFDAAFFGLDNSGS